MAVEGSADAQRGVAGGVKMWAPLGHGNGVNLAKKSFPGMGKISNAYILQSE